MPNSSKSLRVVFDTEHNAYENMAIDEALMFLSPQITLRLYFWKPPAVSIGYFQSMREEVDVEKARKMGVDLVRRITGGGAVYHKHEITYSFVAPKDMFPGSVLSSYRKICYPLVLTLRKLGLHGQIGGVNDIVVEGKKISGSAQTRKRGRILQHGTFLMDVDVDEMFQLLLVPSEKLKDKMIEDVKKRVTSLRHLGVDIDREELAKVMAESFAEFFEMEIEEIPLTNEEMKLAEKLRVEKYERDEWNFRR